MLWLNRQDLAGILYIECPLFAEKIATSLCVALRWHPSWMLQKFKSLIVNRFPSLLRISVDNWITFVPDFFGLWSGDLIYQLGIHLTPFTFHTCEMQSPLVLSFSKIYIMLYVVFNLLIWFWERCMEIYFRTCAGSPQAFRFTSYFPVLICVNITQDLGKTWPYFKIYSKNIWSKKYEEIWKIWRRWDMYDKN